MQPYPSPLLRIRDRFYFPDQFPSGDTEQPPRGGENEIRSGRNLLLGTFVYAHVGGPPGQVAMLDPKQVEWVCLTQLGIIPAQQLRPREKFVPAGRPEFRGEPYVFQGANAYGLMMGVSPTEDFPIFLNLGDFVQPIF